MAGADENDALAALAATPILDLMTPVTRGAVVRERPMLPVGAVHRVRRRTARRQRSRSGGDGRIGALLERARRGAGLLREAEHLCSSETRPRHRTATRSGRSRRTLNGQIDPRAQAIEIRPRQPRTCANGVRSLMAEKTWRKRTLGNRPLKPETLMMGYGYDPMLSEGSLKPPQFQTSTFVFKIGGGRQGLLRHHAGPPEAGPGRRAGPDLFALQQPEPRSARGSAGALGRGGGELAFASGMAAISTALWAFLRPGDVVLQSQPIYGGTETLIHSILPEFGVTQVGFEVEHGTEAMRKRGGARRREARARVGAIFLETPANPTNGLVDIAAARKISESLTRRRQAPAGDRRQHHAGADLLHAARRMAPTSSSRR